MEQEKIIELIEKNISSIQIGNVFSTQTKLFAALGIPIDKKDGNKTIRKAVNLYVKWEKSKNTGAKQITVTEIIESPEHIDGRKNNGGAHNNKYGPIIKPALIRYEYSEPITYSQIDEMIYSFQEWIFTYNPKNKHQRAYRDHLNAYLKSITETALDGLVGENLINYKKVIVIIDRRGLLKDIKIHISAETKLSNLLNKVYGNTSSSLLQKLEQQLNKCVSSLNCAAQENGVKAYKPIAYFDLNAMLVVQFIEKIARNKDFLKLVNGFFGVSQKGTRLIANNEQETMIENIEETICTQLNYTRQEMILNSNKRNQVYRRANIIYWMFGWKYIYKALDINVLDVNKGVEEYPISDFSHEKLLEALESYMIKWTIGNKINQYEVEKNRQETQTRFIGGRGDVIVGSNEDYSYIAKDPQVNKLHCKIFQHPLQEDFFEEYLQSLPSETECTE